MVKASRRRFTSGVQPLHGVAMKLVKDGDVAEPRRIAKKIQDEFWQADTLADIARFVARKDKEKSKAIYREALEVAKRIGDSSDRNRVNAKVISNRISSKSNFEDLMAELELLDDPRAKSSVLSSEMEMRIRKGLPMEQIEDAIEIIAAGDTMNLTYVVDGLVEKKEWDLAAETMLRIQLEPEFEFLLHNFFKGYAKQHSVDVQLDFVSDAVKSEQANLMNIALEQADEKDRPRFREAALTTLVNVSFCEPLYYKLLEHYFEVENFKNVGQLVNITPDRYSHFPVEYIQKEIARRLASQCEKRAEKTGQANFKEIQKWVRPAFAQAAIAKAEINSHLSKGNLQEALKRIDQINVPNARAKLRYNMAKVLIRKEKASNKADEKPESGN